MDRKFYKVFVYGELQDKNIQKFLFGVEIKMEKAFLKHHSVYKDSINDAFLFSEVDSLVEGNVLTLTKKQLLICEQWLTVPKYNKYLKKVLLDGYKEPLYVFVYNKKPKGRFEKVEKSAKKSSLEYAEFLDGAEEFSKQINRKSHELHFTDICLEFEIKSDQIFKRIVKPNKTSHENEKMGKIMANIFRENAIVNKEPLILESRTTLDDKISNFKIIIEQYVNDIYHVYMYFNSQTTTLKAISDLINNLNIDVYDEGSKKTFSELLDFLGVSTEKLFLKRVYLHPYNYFDFETLKKFTKHYPTFILKNKYSIWHSERFEYIFRHIIETRLKFY